MQNTIGQVATVPLYSNWAFWAVIVAAIAIILSQLPPLYLLFKKAKLDIELYSKIHITHMIGNPNLQCHVILNNIGGRRLRIKYISAKIERDGNPIVTLPAQNYDTNPRGTSTILFTRFTLNTEAEWGNSINFFDLFNRTEERNFKEAEALLKEDLYKKHLDNKDNAKPEKKVLIKAKEPLVKPFLEMFNKRFIWESGEYKLIITVSAKPLREEIEKQFRFTLFETDSNNLRKYTEDYATGLGVCYNSIEKHPGIFIQITEET